LGALKNQQSIAELANRFDVSPVVISKWNAAFLEHVVIGHTPVLAFHLRPQVRGTSNSPEAKWCRTVVKEAIQRYGKPEIVNTDQGSQYTSALRAQ